ncbi:peptidoglycan DD-metalloendopeptidase family protein [Flaviaesturariibacter amylovorans]|uniref:DUF3887 domain-containing protein n=1 Tax=Flaviaesturariibacter amylovorans TaxID=1084520 RepID=A0ABP8GHQ6_9BACT
MRFLFCGAFLSMFLIQACAQADRRASDAAAQRLLRQYNAGAYDSIFLSFAPEMQQALPKPATADFFGGLRKDAGKITAQQFVRIQGAAAIYRSTYERGAFLTELVLARDGRIAGLLIKPDTEAPLPVLPKARTLMTFPLSGEWFVFWGGDTREQNYHVVAPAQQGAFDFVMRGPDRRSFRTNGARNEDFYAFGQPLLAPCDGEVVLATDGIADNVPGVMNAQTPLGNAVVIRSDAGEYVVLAHFRRGTVAVKRGQRVKAGMRLGAVGNSGNSSEPHLHLHLQDKPDPQTARGIKCYFRMLQVNGAARTDYSPVRGDRIRRE